MIEILPFLIEWNDVVKKLANKAPVYIRGTGKYGDQYHAGKFKADMINMLGINEFYEDDPIQINIINPIDNKIYWVFLIHYWGKFYIYYYSSLY